VGETCDADRCSARAGGGERETNNNQSLEALSLYVGALTSSFADSTKEGKGGGSGRNMAAAH